MKKKRRSGAKRLLRSAEPRPSPEEYKMALAVETASRSNCMKSHVGAIILFEGRIRATGYNGTIEGYKDCFKGGCPRCKDSSIGRGEQLDRCICVHAEENALVSAARHGIQVESAECFVTHEPCLSCTKLLIQSHIARVVYLRTYEYPTTADHGRSRERMRNQSKAQGKTVFERFGETVKGNRMAIARIAEWEKRLEEMKLKALEYAKKRGITR